MTLAQLGPIVEGPDPDGCPRLLCEYLIRRGMLHFIGTAVLLMPDRNPILLARMLVTLESLPGGRMLLAAGVGWLAEVCAAVDWQRVTSILRSTHTMQTVEVLSTKVLHRYRIFAIVEQALRLPSGRTVVRQVVQHPGAVVIIPLLADGRLLLIEQYRFAVGKTLLEFPAGTLEPGEAPLLCARRELVEEIGYRAEHWHALGIMYSSPGLCDEQQHLFVASALVPDHAEADEDEILEVKRLTVPEVERAMTDGTLVDAKSIAAFARAKLQGVLVGTSADGPR